MGLGLITCGEEEVVIDLHTLIAGVVQVYHRLHVGEEEEKGRKVEQEVGKGGSKRRDHTHVDDHVDEVNGANILSHGAYVCEDENTTTYLRECALRSVDVDSGERIVRCHASMDDVIGIRVVECHASMHVVIGIRVVLCHPPRT